MSRRALSAQKKQENLQLLLFLISLCIYALAGCGPTNTGAPPVNQNGGTSNAGGSTPPIVDSQSASGDVRFLPDRNLTPGDVLEVTKEDVCTPGYSKKVRNVPSEVKKQAYEEYGITTHKPGEYEVDHLISLELGGSNSIKNLWPESYLSSPWNAHVKDRLENKLHEMICSGQIDMKTAQQEIASDWIAAYKKYVGPEPAGSGGRSTSRSTSSPPETETESQAAEAASNSEDKVWVNTRSGVYWKEGTEFYGKTKQGEYMTEREAVRQGYHLPKK